MTTINKNCMTFLDRNENQYGPAPACHKVLQNSGELLSTYSRDFTRGIKSILSERLAYDFGIGEKKILLGYGSEDILKQVVQFHINKGDQIMIPSCSWWYYKKLADEAGGINIEYPIVEGDQAFSYDQERMVDIYKEHQPKLVLISSPNNPTGNRMEKEQLTFVLDNMKSTVVVLDEAYLSFDEKFDSDPVSLINKYRNLIIIRTFSKYYALAGIRTGFAFLGDNYEEFSMVNARYLGFNRLSEMIAIAALDSDEYYTSMARNMAADMEMLYDELNQIPGFKAYKSHANFILVRIPRGIKNSLNEYLLERNMVIKFMNEDGLDTHVRITLGTHSQNCQLLKLLRAFMCKKKSHELVAGV
jgi:histidinol-phosphate aminotransferase